MPWMQNTMHTYVSTTTAIVPTSNVSAATAPQENFVLLGHVQREVKAIPPPLFLERER